MSRLLDRKRGNVYPFQYRNSSSTNIRETFDRLRPGWNKPPEQKHEPSIVHQLVRKKP